jgi:hypothetical protein
VAAHGIKVVGVQAAMSSNARANVGLHLNRRLRSQVIHDLDAVIVALKSWTSFTLHCVIRNSYPKGKRNIRADEKLLPVSWNVALPSWEEPATEQGLRVSDANLRDDDRPCRNPPHAQPNRPLHERLGPLYDVPYSLLSRRFRPSQAKLRSTIRVSL